MSEEEEDKQHEPTQKKLDDARKKGEVAKSTDLTTAASYFGLLVAAFGLGVAAIDSLGTLFEVVLSRSFELAPEMFVNGSPMAAALILETGKAVSPWFLVPALAVLLSVIAQQAFVVAPDKLIPKLSRISPLSNAKNKFGRNGLFEFAKSATKLCIYSVVLGGFLYAKLPEILATISLTPALIGASLMRLTLSFLLIVLAISVAVGAVDFIWQKFEHTRKNRMSRKEVTDEAKQMEGDPHMKQQRRMRAQEIALNQMLTDVPKADVVIVNPTHYAVALKWTRMPGAAPECVAKGVDEIAARIREVAAESGVPIHSDPPTARALFATVEIGEEISSDQYKAVAAAIRFAEMVRGKAKRNG